MRIKVDAWECELCGHVWLATGDEPPEQCAKCRKRGWNDAARMCPYTEYDPESGETYRCSLPEHDGKVKHQRGERI